MRPEQSRELLRALGLLPEDEGVTEGDAATAPADAEVDFDGGPREPAPLPENPGQDHDELLMKIVENMRHGGPRW
jgi:hypothetical protein